MTIFDSLTPLRRISLAAELRACVAKMPTVKAMELVQLARKASALVRELGAGVVLRVTGKDVAGSAAALTAYYESDMPDVAEALKPLERQNVTQMLRQFGKRQDSFDEPDDGQKIAAYNELSKRGLVFDFDRSAMTSKVLFIEKNMDVRGGDSPEYAAANAEHKRLTAEYNDKALAYNALIQKEIDAGNREAYEQYRAERDRLHEDFKALVAAQTNSDRIGDEIHAKQSKERNAVLSEVGAKVVGTMLERSPVSEADAIAWADAQPVDDAAIKNLKKLGYDAAKLRADMAEFYRLSGGRMSHIRIGSSKSKRAYARGISAVEGEKYVSICDTFNKVMLFHELAHHLENDPIAAAASNGFLLKRRESDKLWTLRELAGNTGYRKDEYAYKDSWLNPYIGKVYEDGVTECFSMAVQYLANPVDAGTLALKDPDMLAYVSGYLSSEITPAMKARLALHSEYQQAKKSEANGFEARYDEIIAALSGELELSPDTFLDALKNEGREWLMKADSSATVMPNPVGQYGKCSVFFGIYRNPVTKRQSKGFAIYDNTDVWRIVRYAVMHQPIAVVRAALRLSEVAGIPISTLAYRYFQSNANKAALVKFYDEIKTEKTA